MLQFWLNVSQWEGYSGLYIIFLGLQNPLVNFLVQQPLISPLLASLFCLLIKKQMCFN